MNVDIKEIITYAKCPMLYRLKYKSTNINNKYINTLEKYEEDLHKTAYLFFAELQNNKQVSVEVVKKAWGKLWINEKSSKELIYSKPASWRDRANEKRKTGIKSIISFYNNFKDNPGFPIAVNYKYSIPINSSITLTGTFELIREVNKLIEIVDFKTEDKSYNAISVEKDLSLTAASLAFRKLFEEKEDRLLYYGFNKGKMHYTKRNDKDYEILYNTVTCIAKAIHNELYYACPKSSCFSCSYKKICLNELR